MTTLPGNDSGTPVATSTELIDLCRDDAVKAMLVRDVEDEAMHVCAQHFFHDATERIRGVWLVKVKDSTAPRIALVEMDVSDFLKLRKFRTS